VPKMTGHLSEIWQKIVQQFPYLPRALGLVWTAAPRLTMAWLSTGLILGLLPGLTVWLSKPLVNGITAAIHAGGDWNAIKPVIGLALILAGLILVGELLNSVQNWVSTAQSEKIGDHISLLIHRQSVTLDLAFYDLPAYYDHLHRARYEAGHRPLALLESIGNLMRNTVTLAVMATLVLPYGWWLPLLLIASTIPALYVALNHTLRQYHWRLKITEDERRTWYYDWLLTAREPAAELRLFNLGVLLQRLYQTLRQQIRKGRLRLIQNQALASLAANTAGILAAGSAMIWMIWRTLKGHATLGDLILFYQAFSRGQGLMRSLLEDLAKIYGNTLFLGDLFEFLDLRPQVTDPSSTFMSLRGSKTTEAIPPKDKNIKLLRTQGSLVMADPTAAIENQGMSISFHHVNFHYQGSSRPTLTGLNLEIKPGQIAAIVGANGAGKSTLVKLLCRFYDPDSGKAEINGMDLKSIPLDVVRSRVSALFQEPVHYSATVAQNISLAERSQVDDDTQHAAAAAGADRVIQRLPSGYDTLLGTWFKGGTDLSVGEWQRLAVARAFMRPSSVLVLDEPTSAMDPWAEADWLKNLRTASKGRTVLLITHRLTTAMTADVIFVMANGQVVESGSHAELMAAGGAYAASWQTQHAG
jgi:ATP-binding cassette, subfamily B, bacterial